MNILLCAPAVLFLVALLAAHFRRRKALSPEDLKVGETYRVNDKDAVYTGVDEDDSDILNFSHTISIHQDEVWHAVSIAKKRKNNS